MQNVGGIAAKTTLLGALLASCADTQRIVTVEETFELAVDGPDLVALQGRQASLEGTGEITLRRLVKEALRMRPDRLVVGEVRDAEALDLVLALNTGVSGAGTVHANSATEALEKLTILPLLAGRNIDRSFIAPALADCLGYLGPRLAEHAQVPWLRCSLHCVASGAHCVPQPVRCLSLGYPRGVWVKRRALR